MRKVANPKFCAVTIFFAVTVPSIPASAGDAKIDCKDIICLHKKFNSCDDDSSTCFKILNTQLKKAKDCKKPQDSRDFLKTVKYLGDNVEASEYMSEEIENFFIEKPKCLLEGALLLDAETQGEVMNRVQNPHMVEDGESKIEKNISKFKHDKAYSKLFISSKKTK